MKKPARFASVTFRFFRLNSRWPIGLAVLTVGLTTVVGLWAQSRRAPATLDDLTLREFSNLAILEPEAVSALLENAWTAEQRAESARAHLAMTNAAAYQALYAPLNAAQRAAHEEAVYEFTHPEVTAAKLAVKREHPAYREAEARAIDAIRNPVPSRQP